MKQRPAWLPSVFGRKSRGPYRYKKSVIDRMKICLAPGARAAIILPDGMQIIVESREKSRPTTFRPESESPLWCNPPAANRQLGIAKISDSFMESNKKVVL